MANIRFLFYKAAVDGKWLDDAISIYTGIFPCNWGTKGYSHVECWFADENGEFEILDPEPQHCGDDNWDVKYAGQCFSSTTRGDAKGVRFAPASEVLRHPERWDYQEFEVKGKTLRIIKGWCALQVGLKYDFAGLFGFFLPFNIHNERRWYCSEVCGYTAYLFSLIKHRKRISPRRLSKVLGGEIKNLK